MHRTTPLKVFVLLSLVLAWGGVAQGAAESLSTLKKRLGAALEQANYPAASKEVAAIAAIDSPEAAALLLSLGARAPHPQVYEACAGAFASTTSEEVLSRIASGLKVRDEPTVSLAAEMLTRVRDAPEAAREPLLEAFLDLRGYPRTEAVQSIVLRWLRQNRDARWGLRALIDMRVQLQRGRIRDGRLFHDTVEALWDVTGQEYENATDWEKYWDTQATLPDWHPQPQDAAGAQALGRKQAGGRTAVARRNPSFFGREVRSERALFIIDVSGSMLEVDPGQPQTDEDEEPVLATTPEGKTAVARRSRIPRLGGPDFGQPGERTRIQRVKRQLYRMIERYPEGRYFAILAFSTDVVPVVAARKRKTHYPVRMNAKSRRDALEKVLSLKADGFTRTDLAFETAFSFEGINTIYLLSDGYPQKDPDLAKMTPQEQFRATSAMVREILELVATKNRTEGRRWQIHTLGFRRAGLASFLGQLARTHGGEFSEVP